MKLKQVFGKSWALNSFKFISQHHNPQHAAGSYNLNLTKPFFPYSQNPRQIVKNTEKPPCYFAQGCRNRAMPRFCGIKTNDPISTNLKIIKKQTKKFMLKKKTNNKAIVIFENQPVRRLWDEKKEKWYFSVIDIIAVLINQKDFQLARNYWKVLKNRLNKERNETVTKCNRLKMLAQDGKMRETDVADVETILRLVQSVPSPKAEPIKLWLAKVGYERMQEINDPEKALNRSRDYWQKMGRSQKWVQQRMMGQETRNKLTDYWKDNEVKEKNEYAILTNIIHQEWSDLSVKEHKNIKNLKTENLRDHMSDAELIFTALAELSTRQIAETMETKGLEKNKTPARKGGRIAKNARMELERKTGKKVVSGNNFKSLPERKKLKSK